MGVRQVSTLNCSGVSMRTDLQIQPRIISMGAGLTTTRWVVVQDGRIRELFQDYDRAVEYMTALTRDWESQDE